VKRLTPEQRHEESASRLILSDVIERRIRALEQKVRRGEIVTHLTPEQRGRLPIFANGPKDKRLKNMQWLAKPEGESSWAEIISHALLLAYESEAPILECLPDWVKNKQELKMEPFAWWWWQRVKAAYRTWKVNFHGNQKDQVSIGETLGDLPGEANNDVELELASQETAALIVDREAREERRLGRKLTAKERDALRKATKPELDANVGKVSKVFMPGCERTASAESFDDSVDSAPSRIDRKLAALDAVPKWGKMCCCTTEVTAKRFSRGTCWRCGYYAGFRPAKRQPSPLLQNPEMRDIINAIDNRKAEIAAEKDRLKRTMRESLHHGLPTKAAKCATEPAAAPLTRRAAA
jgi:hypothetical protein